MIRRALMLVAAVALTGPASAAEASTPAGFGPASAAVASTPAGLGPASAFLLLERDTGTVVYAGNPDAELPVASLTKLMTAYVTVEREPANAVLTEQPYDPTEGESLANVPPGTRLALPDMLRAMLLPSGNDVANSIAIDVGGSVPHFVALMAFWASQLHLGRSTFTTPVGLDTPPGNHSTAFDIARLANVLLRDPLVAAIVDERSARLADGQVVRNRNDLVGRYGWIVGMKTGHTLDAGYCMVGAASLDGVHLVSVVLGAPSVDARDDDTVALLRYGLERYRRSVIARTGQLFATLPVAGHPHRRVRIVASRRLALVLARSARLHAALRLPAQLTGPLPAGAVAGSIVVRENGRVIRRVLLVTASAVPPPPAPVRRRRGWIIWAGAGGVLLASLAGCSLTLMRRRTRRSAAIPVPR